MTLVDVMIQVRISGPDNGDPVEGLEVMNSMTDFEIVSWDFMGIQAVPYDAEWLPVSMREPLSKFRFAEDKTIRIEDTGGRTFVSDARAMYRVFDSSELGDVREWREGFDRMVAITDWEPATVDGACYAPGDMRLDGQFVGRVAVQTHYLEAARALFPEGRWECSLSVYAVRMLLPLDSPVAYIMGFRNAVEDDTPTHLATALEELRR